MSYKSAGVDIEAGEESVKRIKTHVKKTFTKGVLGEIGLFGGFFELDLAKWKQPVLTSSVDGVGTKIKVALMAQKFDTVGQDLVNHCTNDILVCGAYPLYFLDYFATGKLSPEMFEQVILGFSKACIENECALIGGETAEMPGIYANEDFDLAGTIVGCVEKSKIIDGTKVHKGDVLIALPSTGLHTNGYSLARKVLFEVAKLDVSTYDDELGTTIGDALLAVHKSYLNPIKNLLDNTDYVNGLSHVTGGGIIGNTNRILREGMTVEMDWSSWKVPPIFTMIQKLGKISDEEMRKAFNIGIGLLIAVKEENVDSVLAELKKSGESPFVAGRIN
ncbi:MAG: phosphoribosylformylglycinamidine cyclo-ligase [Calditrichaeota bacterium]|nr:MAG: phosphoribosylformylglycinamidine cyclo-ligase [Calditrichota bacterium]